MLKILASVAKRRVLRYALSTGVAALAVGVAATLVLGLTGLKQSGKVSPLLAEVAGRPGIWVVSPLSGAVQRRLSGPSTAVWPEVTLSGWNYFAVPGPRCVWSLWRTKPESGVREPVFDRLASLSAYSVDSSGSAAAVAVDQGGQCGGAGARTFIEILRLSGRVVLSVPVSAAFALAWAPNSYSLVLVLPSDTAGAAARLRFVSDALSRRSFATSSSVPCPGESRNCAQWSPAFDSEGELFYLAVNDLRAVIPCDIGICATQRYEVVRWQAGSKPVVLADQIASAGYQPWLAVDWNGREVVFSVGKDTYLWNHGAVRRLRTSLSNESW
jgi:hypothetical protein